MDRLRLLGKAEAGTRQVVGEIQYSTRTVNLVQVCL